MKKELEDMIYNDRYRKRKFQVYLLPEEDALLEVNAWEYGLSKSEYIRKLIREETLVVEDKLLSDDSKKLLYELNKIGSNLNQIAYNVNVQKSMRASDFERLKNNYSELIRLMAKLPYLAKDAAEEWQFFADKIIRDDIFNKGGE